MKPADLSLTKIFRCLGLLIITLIIGLNAMAKDSIDQGSVKIFDNDEQFNEVPNPDDMKKKIPPEDLLYPGYSDSDFTKSGIIQAGTEKTKSFRSESFK